tara:strand:- start:872 stop:1021 length:150 start_codon:yes stop_codon:yes gene_type:complete
MKGTSARKIIENKKIKKENLKSFLKLIDEKQNITIIPKEMKIKCLKKKE